MTEKEATVFIIDVGESMGQAHNGRLESDLDWCMRWVWDKLTTVVAASRKTLNVGVLGLKTDKTAHPLQEEEGYENISLIHPLAPLTMNGLRKIHESIKPNESTAGDAISAIVIAIEMIENVTKKLKYKRQIFLVTDGQGAIDGDEIDEIAKKLVESGIELTVLGVDFDEEEYGFKEEHKSRIKRKNEQLLATLVEQCGEKAQFATIAEAIEQLDIPRIKAPRPYRSYEGTLTLGKVASSHFASISINVERYFKTKLARQMTATTVVVKVEQGGPSQSTDTVDGDAMEGVEGTNFAAVKTARTYKVNDPNAPGGKRDVGFDSLAKGYEYGRTAVPMSESDMPVTKLQTFKGFEIIGFVASDKYEPFLNLGESCITIARKGDTNSQLALSSLIHALSELESYAVARLVTKDDNNPLLVLLCPDIDVDVECFYDVPLPFAEDVRGYQFPPLDKVITVSGTTLTKHRLLPSDELNQAMDDYVDAMDISEAGLGVEGQPEEYAMIEDSFNPLVHRVNQVVKSRAVHPDQPVPPVPPILVRYAAPPDALVGRTKVETEKLITAAEVKKVPPKAKGKRQREAIKPLSGLDIDALLGENKATATITPENAIPDFKRALNAAEELSEIEDAAKQMGEIIRQLMADSFADSQYARARENMGVMRYELIALEEPGLYNSFVRDLKKKLLSGELGGDRRDMWLQIRVARLGLIDDTQSEVSKVTKEEANEFYKSVR